LIQDPNFSEGWRTLHCFVDYWINDPKLGSEDFKQLLNGMAQNIVDTRSNCSQ